MTKKQKYKTKFWDKEKAKLVEGYTTVYEPDNTPKGKRITNSNVKIICPKTGEVIREVTPHQKEFWKGLNNESDTDRILD